MMTVKQVSDLTGISVRALHHYDSIGLLHPTCITDAGYRMYNSEALEKLQLIMLFRELRFPLKEIAQVISKPDFDRKAALKSHIELLRLQREHLDELISLAQTIEQKGMNTMDFSAFDTSKIDEYAKQAKEKWGGTAAYGEYEEKASSRTKGEEASLGAGLMAHFERLGMLRDKNPACPEAQEAVDGLRRYITDNFYNCTPEILSSLGEMYVAGGEMTENIDKAGGEGTAAFAKSAIDAYCKSL